MKPLEALKKAMFYISGLCYQRTPNQPGAVINGLSPETRKALSQLKSTDINGGPKAERIDELKYYVGTDKWYKEQEFKKDRLDFDKKILK